MAYRKKEKKNGYILEIEKNIYSINEWYIDGG